MKFEAILRKSQKELKQALASELTRFGYQTQVRKGFVYAKGSVPVLLVAHLDTVHKENVKTICYSSRGEILMSPEGIGGDDRAGVYMILQLILTHRCHVLFCEDEEIGGIGAGAFVESGIKPAVNYIVEFDRRGSKDAVFYSCENPEFTAFVCSFGFVEEFGTFSDISLIAPRLQVAAVNISAGYHCEHTRHEHINLVHVRRNIELASKMIGTATGRFEYIESPRFPLYYGEKFMSARLISPTPPDSYFIDQKGEMLEGWDTLWVDAQGDTYERFYSYGVATRLAGCSVFTKQGFPVRFDKRRAELVEIVPMEDVYELL